MSIFANGLLVNPWNSQENRQENRDGSFDVIFQAVVKNHLTTQRCFNTFVINELCFLAWACIDEEAKNHNALPR